MLERMLKDPNHRVRANAINCSTTIKTQNVSPLYTLLTLHPKMKMPSHSDYQRFQQDTHLTMLESLCEDSRVVEKAKNV